jgi:glycerol-3-phosphate cytidylyltransferase
MTSVSSKGTTLSTDRSPARYCFDIDGTLCTTDDSHQYSRAEPFYDAIKEVNRLYDEGHEITLFTARGTGSGVNWHPVTIAQLSRWGVKYHKLIDKDKPRYDIFVDDKATNAIDWRNSLRPLRVGFVASAFDLLHAGHCLMLRDAKDHCDKLIAALQTDPSIDRPEKNKPVMSIHERYIILKSNRFVDDIFIYRTETELLNILQQVKPDVRILGSDYKYCSEKIVGAEFCKEIYFHDRSAHNYSTTNLRQRIENASCDL